MCQKEEREDGMKQTANPAALVTRRLLAESLLRLMESNSYKDITILQITQEAQVARRTFYRNFDSKEELLRYAIALLSEEFLASLLAKEKFVIKESVCLLLELCREHRVFFKR